MHLIKLILIFAGLTIAVFSCKIENRADREYKFPELSGPYLGQTPPGDEPELFAPGIIGTAMYTRDMAISPAGSEIYFCVSALGYNLIFYTKQENGRWTEPAPAPFISEYQYMHYEPHITPENRRLLFLSNMPEKEGEEGRQDIWAVDRISEGWGKPYNLGAPVNSEGSEFFPSATKDGTLYFTRAEKGSRLNFIYRSRLVDGKYSEAEKLGPEVNCGTNRYNAFVDPDERFVIVPAEGMEDGFGGTDYYIVFRDENDNWSRPVNLGEKVNSARGREWSPYVSPDGKYFFFMASRTKQFDQEKGEKPDFRKMQELFTGPQNGNADIYWMKADFLFELQKQ